MEAYNYLLPDERIAKFPLPQRDESRLLLYKDGRVGETAFKQMADYLPEGSLLVFNNTRVIQARLLFRKETGAQIELFCLEPYQPHDYALAFRQTARCAWVCMAGNLKKWKEGALRKEWQVKDRSVCLKAERKQAVGDAHVVEFSWNDASLTFADLLEEAGVLPIPPYLRRKTQASDLDTYQTVYAKVKGSVAAPTAGLHFTPEMLAGLDKAGFEREEVTLHVGAGTFKPVKSETLGGHRMHTEFIAVSRTCIEHIKEHPNPVIAIGTTSVRTLETLYYAGVVLAGNPQATPGTLTVGQWTPYLEANNRLTAEQALQHILDYLDRWSLDKLTVATQILIAPGYTFKLVKGMVTNFHQPESTLLLLVDAFVKGDWKNVYRYALSRDFRFLSYGDSSLLL
jgi:S-adenosylmethionine:tRNA ribosyltransferase-isomerase